MEGFGLWAAICILAVLSDSEDVEWCYPEQLEYGGVTDSNGGFGGGDVPKSLVDHCQINVLDAKDASADDFLRQCFNTPCLIRNAVSQRWSDAWTFANMVEAYGDVVVKTNAEAHYEGNLSLLGNFLKSDVVCTKAGCDYRKALKVWDGFDGFSGLGPRLLDEDAWNVTWRYGEGEGWELYRKSIGVHPLRDRTLPSIIRHHHLRTGSAPSTLAEAFGSGFSEAFVAGGACAGTYLHFHGPAVATLPHGMKRWAFVHPDADMQEYEGRSELLRKNFFEHHVPKRLLEPTRSVRSTTGSSHPVLTCTQGPGDVVFTANDWFHATMNIWPSVASVMEIANEPDWVENAAKRLGCDKEKDVADLYMRYYESYDRIGGGRSLRTEM